MDGTYHSPDDDEDDDDDEDGEDDDAITPESTTMFDRISDRFRDTSVVIIGGGGIGGALVRQLLDSDGRRVRIVVADHDVRPLERLQEGCRPDRILTHQLDVRDREAVAEFFAITKSTVGVPDFLFYTAGMLTVDTFAATTGETWERAVEVNLNGAFYCVKAVTELMIPERRGSILLVGSIAGTKARSGSRVNPVYNATKAGLAAFVNATAMQIREHGIRINCVSPGPTDTPMMDVQPAQIHRAIREITLDGRLNHPMEVAELALFVAAHGRFTGEDVCMGGGAGLGG